MEYLKAVFIDFPLAIFNTQFSLFGYDISLGAIFIFGVLAGIAGLILRNLFGG